MCVIRRTIAYLCINIIKFDAVDFSERRSEEVISFFWRSVYVRWDIMIFHWRQWKWQTHFALLQEYQFCHLLPFAKVGQNGSDLLPLYFHLSTANVICHSGEGEGRYRGMKMTSWSSHIVVVVTSIIYWIESSQILKLVASSDKNKQIRECSASWLLIDLFPIVHVCNYANSLHESLILINHKFVRKRFSFFLLRSEHCTRADAKRQITVR